MPHADGPFKEADHERQRTAAPVLRRGLPDGPYGLASLGTRTEIESYLEGHTRPVALSGDGKLLATGSADGRANLMGRTVTV